MEGISDATDGLVVVRVNAPAREDKANERAIQLLAKHFRVPPSHIRLSQGRSSKIKVFELG
jgi:uncharacterized protein